MASYVERGAVTNGHGHKVLQQPHPRLVPLPDGPTCVFAIGTACPPTTIEQKTYPEKLFEMCGVGDNKPLLQKLKYMCECW